MMLSPGWDLSYDNTHQQHISPDDRFAVKDDVSTVGEKVKVRSDDDRPEFPDRVD
jgi:hypothetical protein